MGKKDDLALIQAACSSGVEGGDYVHSMELLPAICREITRLRKRVDALERGSAPYTKVDEVDRSLREVWENLGARVAALEAHREQQPESKEEA